MYGLVISCSIRNGKSGVYWTGDIKTLEGTIQCVMWECESKFPQKYSLIKITDFRDQLETRFKNLVIKKYDKVAKEDIPEIAESLLTVPGVPAERIESAWEYLLSLATQYSNAKIGEFVYRVLRHVEEKFKNAPAAVKMHHNYKGGLVIHTAEVVKIANSLCGAVCADYITKDVVLAAATLHDIGKIKTYYLNEIGLCEKTPMEHAVGHIYYGMSIVEQQHNLLALLNEREFDEIMHAIAAHHGDPNKGSVKEIDSLESMIVHQADYLSAKFGIVESAFLYNEQYRGNLLTMAIAQQAQIHRDKKPDR